MIEDHRFNLNLNVKVIVLSVLGAILSFTILCFLLIQTDANRVYTIDSPQLTNIKDDAKVGIVFGGSVTDDEPLPIVRDRLDMGKRLLDEGIVDKLILSGDNRSPDYNEPAVMYEYMATTLGVSKAKLQPDFAGRSTYETCERAHKIFGLDSAILISESTHLPRAIYLCRHFGVDAYGVESDGPASSGPQISQRWRELLARNKAIINAHLYGEKTILGEPIKL